HKVGRRQFMQRALAVGLSASAATSLLAACGGGNTIGGTTTSSSNSGPTKSSTVDLLNLWTGEEKDSFDAVTTPYIQQNKVTINVETTRDLSATLTTRI